MAKYLVVQLRRVEDGTPEDPHCWTEPTPVPCEDTRAVHAAIREVQDEPDADWTVFEWDLEVRTPNKWARRAVVFKRDGGVSYDVEVS